MAARPPMRSDNSRMNDDVDVQGGFPRSQSSTSITATRFKPTPAESPLTQQSRPEVLEPKIVGLYRYVFQDIEDDELSTGFWHEFFLLKPDAIQLHNILQNASAESLLQNQHHTQQVLLQAIECIRDGSNASENALDTLTIFFTSVLHKKYTNLSSDVIEILAGLDRVDAIFHDLVSVLEHAIKLGERMTLRLKAVRTTIAVVSGSYQTALISYFVQRDFFPALTTLIRQLDNPLMNVEPFLLMGILTNFHKFESHNQYSVRLSDHVDTDVMTRIVESIAWTSTILRERYIVIADDTPAGWTLKETLSYVGLGALSGGRATPPVLNEEQKQELFADQPGAHAAMLLSVYDFVLANKLFAEHLVSMASVDQGHPPPFSLFLSFASYLTQHAFRSARTSAYSQLTLLILRIIVEEPATAKHLCEITASIRLCRQRPPYLPLVRTQRTYAAALVDVLVDLINGNLRKRLDTSAYIQTMIVLKALLTYLAKSRTKLEYHWSELWRSLLSFVRFLTTYATELKALPDTEDLVLGTSSLLVLAVSSSEAFLPDPSAYDDLVYKLVESGDALAKLRDDFAVSKSAASQPISTLLDVVKHYQGLIDAEGAKKTHLSPRAIGKIIKQGYETLSIESNEDVEGQRTNYKEIEHKTALKKMTRVAVADAVALVMDAQLRSG